MSKSPSTKTVDLNRPDLLTVIRWMDKAEENCRKTGRLEAAVLWRDARSHLEQQRDLADRALSSLRSFDPKLADHIQSTT